MRITKAFSVRMSKSMWAFLKKSSIVQEKSMNVIILSCLEKYKNRVENGGKNKKSQRGENKNESA